MQLVSFELIMDRIYIYMMNSVESVPAHNYTLQLLQSQANHRAIVKTIFKQNLSSQTS